MFNPTPQFLKRFLSLLAVLVLFTSCDDESKPVTFKSKSIDIAYEANITAAYDKAIDNSDRSEHINKNIEQTITGILSTSKSNVTIETILKDFNSEFVNFQQEFPDASEPVWELNIETEITYQSQDIITIAISTYEFKGGAHGNDTIIFLNLDAKTGTVLNQEDIIENTNDFIQLAKLHFINALETEKENAQIEDFFFGKPFQLPENIGFTEDGLVLLYNTYEVASYNQGYTEFVIPFNEAQSFLKVH